MCLLGEGIRVVCESWWRGGRTDGLGSREGGSKGISWGMWEKTSGWRGASEQGTHTGRKLVGGWEV